MTATDRPTVAVFRPDDERMAAAVERLRELDVEPLADPMLAIDPTDAAPPTGTDYLVMTSKTGASLLADADWTPAEHTTVVAIGSATARALEAAGIEVDSVPAEYSSAGLLAHLEDDVEGKRVAVARSDHGTERLLEGLQAAGATVEETVLYRLRRPPGAGRSVRAAAAGRLDAALFTSSLTVEHFLAAAGEQDRRDAAIAGLDRAVVGAIGSPTRETAASAGITVDVVPVEATFDALATAVVSRLES